MTEPTDEDTFQNALAALQLDGARQSESDDQALIAAISAGDSSALELLYDRYAAGVYQLALRMLKRPELAEELVQEAFWRIWQRSGSFDRGRGHVAAWLFSIARNLCIDELRRLRTRPLVVYQDVGQPVIRQLVDEQADLAAAALASERRQIVIDALSRLPHAQRQAIALAYFGGLTQREIATRLGQPLGTIKTRVRLGMLRLRDILGTAGREAL